jgi:hypothetical protein
MLETLKRLLVTKIFFTSVIGTGNEKTRNTVILSVLANERKLPPYIILQRQAMRKEKVPTGLVFWCQEKGWMTNDLMMDWIKDELKTRLPSQQAWGACLTCL